MFAVVYFGGKQYRLREKDEVDVEKLAIEAGKNFKINEVLLLAEEDGSSLKIGMPFVAGAHVECQVLAQGKAKKILVFKFQSKKHYEIMAEASRLLKSGGKLLIIDWSNSNSGLTPSSDRRVNPDKMTEICSQLGLVLEQQFRAGQYHFGMIFRKQ